MRDCDEAAIYMVSEYLCCWPFPVRLPAALAAPMAATLSTVRSPSGLWAKHARLYRRLGQADSRGRAWPAVTPRAGPAPY